MIQIDKLLRFRLYHQEILVTIIFFFTRKRIAKKAATIKKFEYLPIGSELKRQTDSAKKKYQVLHKVYEFDKKRK